MKAAPPLTRFTRLVIEHRAAVITAISVMTLVLGMGALRLRVDIDPDQQLPQSHPYIKTLNRVNHLFGDKNLVIIGLTPRDGDPFSVTFLEKAGAITRLISELPGADSTLLRSLASASTTLVRRGPGQLIVEPTLPEHLTSTAADELRDHALSHPIFRGTLVSYDGTTLGLYFTVNLTPALPGYVNVHRAILDILQREDDGTFSYLLSGPVVIASQLNTQASTSTSYLLLSLLVIGLIHYHAFRSWQAVVLPIATGLIAVLWAMGAMGHLGIALDPFNATTPILILAVGAGHAVQLLKRYYEELDTGLSNRASIIRSIESAGGAMIVAGTIAIVSFLSLSTLGTQSMRTFGLLTAFGVSSALLIEMTLIPAVRSFAGRPRSAGSRHSFLDTPLRLIAESASSPRRARTLLFSYASLVGLCGFFAANIEVDTSFKRNLSQADAVRKDDDALNERFAGTNDLLILIEAEEGSLLTDPVVIAAISRFQRRLRTIAGVGATISFVDTLQIIHAAIRDSGDRSELPSSRDLASQYLLLYSMSGGGDLGTILSPDYRFAKLSVLLHRDSTHYGEEVIRVAQQIAREELPATVNISVAGTLASNAALTEVMVSGKLLNILQVVCITAVVASVMFRSILLGALVVLPVGASLIVIFGLMGLSGTPMDVGTSVVCALSVGIGADYAVYFLARIQEELRLDAPSYQAAVRRATATSGLAIVYVASAIALGYLTLCLSDFRLFEQLGGMVAVAMLSAAGSTLIVLPALLTCLPQSLRSNPRSLSTGSTPGAIGGFGTP